MPVLLCCCAQQQTLMLLLLLLLLLLLPAATQRALVHAECVMNITSYQLYKKLSDPIIYNRRVHPGLSGPTVILLGIYINGFNYISEQSMDYEINLYLREQWWDPRLAFNESQLCGVEFMKLPDRAWDKIWVPDVFFRNEKKAAFHEVTLPNRLMRLYPNGTVYYAAKITATLSCQMKLHKYPLDTQVCPIQFESFGHTVKANVYQWRPMPVETDEQLILPQFELHATNTRNCQQTYATGDYPCLEVEFVLRRNIGYYLIQLYVPSVLIVILSWVAFWISIDAIPARVTIGLLTVLTMTTQSATARASLPRVSYIKAMDVWMSICLLFVFASLLEFAVVNVFSRKEIRKKSQGLNILSETAKNFEEMICAQALTVTGLTNIRPARRPQPAANASASATSGAKRRFLEAGWDDEAPAGLDDADIAGGDIGGSRAGAPPAGPFSAYSRRQAHKRREEMRQRARVIDKLARKLFPLAFVLFNVVYWIGYNLW